MTTDRTDPCASPEAFDDEREPTLITGAPIISLDELDAWIARHPDGKVARLFDDDPQKMDVSRWPANDEVST